MTTLSELNRKLNQANKVRANKEKLYQKRLKEVDDIISELKSDIESYVSIGDAKTYQQLKDATSILYPLDYSKYSITSLRKLLNSNLGWYLSDFKSQLVNTLDPKYKDEEYHNLRLSNLEIQDNSYGGDSKKYTSMVQKGYTTEYHPCLGGLGISSEATDEQLENLLLVISRVLKDDNIGRNSDYWLHSYDREPIRDTYTMNKYTKDFLQLLYPKVNMDENDIDGMTEHPRLVNFVVKDKANVTNN